MNLLSGEPFMKLVLAEKVLTKLVLVNPLSVKPFMDSLLMKPLTKPLSHSS